MILRFFPLVSPLQRHLLAFRGRTLVREEFRGLTCAQDAQISHSVFPAFCMYHRQANNDICDNVG